MSNTHERQLVKEYVDAKTADKLAKENAKNAAARLAIAENAIYFHLQGERCYATASYDDLGRTQMNMPRIFASIKEGREAEFKEWLKKKDAKENKEKDEKTEDWLFVKKLASGTLSSFITELIDNDEPVPRCIDLFAKKQLKRY